ncbi:hypothetical protein GF389_00650 [Candidatus Dojkabacteria bacterium]|nr:hypothetical protein [Candidatus Dojkabacteria bacterium]
MDTSTLLSALRSKLAELKITQNHFQKKLENFTPDFQDTDYVKNLAKLSEIDSKIGRVERSIKLLKRKKRKELFVNLSSRVKLVSIDFEVTLWVDAKNLADLIGKRVGDIVELYNTKYTVAGIY